VGSNDALVALFKEMRELIILEEGSPNAFRARAYETAADAIATYRGELEALSEKDLTRIDGVGASTAKKIREFYQTGRIARLEELRKAYPPDFVALAKIPGLGPKTLLRLRSEIGIQNLTDLRAAIEQKKLRDMKGLGAKMEEKILHAIARMGLTGKDKRVPLTEALPVARELVLELEKLPEVERALYCGSLRRFRESIADVDIVVSSREPAAVMARFVKMGRVSEVIGSGDTKTSVLTATGLQVDLRIVEPSQFGAACQYFTGSKSHNIKLRQIALDRGWLLNEYGLTVSETGEVIASDTEEAIYRALGLDLIPPPMREDRGEIEAALEGRLLSPVALEDLRGDLHVHTSLSGDGRSSLEDMVAEASSRGYTYLALTDHGENLAFNGVSREKFLEQRKELEALKRRYPKMTLLHGVELNMGADGRLDYDEAFRRGFDWAVAGVHSHFDLDSAAQTKRVMAAMDDPTVNAIAHLTGRRLGKRPGIELDVDAILQKAAETGCAIEINSALGRLDASSEVLFRARELDVTFVMSTDAHHTREYARMEWGVLHATRGWVDPSRIANTWPKKKFLDWAAKRRDR
jgi:DNA polymerase (family X)